jgi:hypothetical protein
MQLAWKDINDLQFHRRPASEIEKKTQQIEDVQRILNHRDFAAVLQPDTEGFKIKAIFKE